MGTLYIGMDIHKNYVYAVGLDNEGRKQIEQRFSSSEIGTFLDQIGKGCKVAIESTTCWVHIYEAIESKGIKTVLVNVQGTKQMMKTDKLDAYRLADGLRTGYLKTSYIPPVEIRGLRDLTRHRQSLLNSRKGFKNRIHSILIKRGIRHSFTDLFGKGGREWLEGLDIGSETKRLHSYLAVIDGLDSQIAEFDTQIEKSAKLNSQAMLLTTISGISYLSALSLVAEAGDIGRFPRAKKYARYVGLVPTISQSGSHTYMGRTVKDCSRESKRILVQATRTHVRHCNSDITRHYRKLVRRGVGENKAIVSAANKMARVVWAMLTYNQVFKEKV